MADQPQLLDDWTPPERWAWQCIAEGRPADFNARPRESDPAVADLDPTKPEGWSEDRRLRVGFLRTILTGKSFVETTPFSGVVILGALVDDAPLDLAHARLPRRLSLSRSRLLVPINGRCLRVDGELSFEDSFASEAIALDSAEIRETLHLSRGTFEGSVNLNGAEVEGKAILLSASFKAGIVLVGTSIGASLDLGGSTVAGKVNLNGTKVAGAVFLRNKALFRGDVDLTAAAVGASLDMSGSTFEKRVSLNGITVTGPAFLNENASFKGEVNLASATFGASLDMSGSTFDKSVSLNGITVSGPAFLNKNASFKGDVNFANATVGAILDTAGSTFAKSVSLNGTKVAGAVFLHQKTIFEGDVNLANATFGASLDMSGSTFNRNVSLNGATVTGPAFLNRSATFERDLDITAASIGGNLEMNGSTFKGTVRLSRAAVTGFALLRDGAAFKDVFLGGASIGSDLDLSNATFSGRVDATGARIEGELRLGSARHLSARWGEGSCLVLRNASCGAVQDRWKTNAENAWPKSSPQPGSPPCLDLEGFTYRRLGGLYGDKPDADMVDRPSASYVELLARDSTDSPQPYEYLALMLREAGEPEKASDILFAARERRRRGLWRDGRPLRWTGMSLLRYTIGYGIGAGYAWVLLWVVVLTFLGAALTKASGALPGKDGVQLLFLSLDELLPVITLDRAHDTMLTSAPPGGAAPPPSWLLAWFYFHKIAGWVLGSFLVAGLAGLTQRN